MPQAVEVDLKDIVLSNSTFGPKEIERLSRGVADDIAQFAVLRDSVAELEMREDRSPATAVRLGVCYYLLGRHRRAVETLSSSDGGALAKFYLGKSLAAVEKYTEAIAAF